MQIDRGDTMTMSRPPEATFTGEVHIGGYFRRTRPSRLAGATVRFAPGARTPWKINPIGQIVVITSGSGRVQTQGQKIAEVHAGDVVWFDPGEPHWEGAAPNSAMTYFAIQEEDVGGVVFGDAVSDEEYADGRRNAP